MFLDRPMQRMSDAQRSSPNPCVHKGQRGLSLGVNSVTLTDTTLVRTRPTQPLGPDDTSATFHDHRAISPGTRAQKRMTASPPRPLREEGWRLSHLTVNGSVTEAVLGGDSASLASMSALVLPFVVGVPVMRPVVGLMVSPAGRSPDLTPQPIGASPPSDAMCAVYRLPTFAVERVFGPDCPVGNTMQKRGVAAGDEELGDDVGADVLGGHDTGRDVSAFGAVDEQAGPGRLDGRVFLTAERHGGLKQTASVPVAAAKCRVSVTCSRVADEKPVSSRVSTGTGALETDGQPSVRRPEQMPAGRG